MKVRGLLGEKTISLRAKMVLHLLFVLSEGFLAPYLSKKERETWFFIWKAIIREREKKRKERKGKGERADSNQLGS